MGLTLLVASTVLAACSSDPAPNVTAVKEPGGPSARAMSPTTPPKTEDRTGRKLTKAEAVAALPSVKSLPAGWAVDPDHTVTSDNEADLATKFSPASCQTVFDGMDANQSKQAKAAEADADFTRSELGPFVGVTVASFVEKVPERLLGDFVAALDKCPSFTITDPDGTSKVTASVLSFPTLGQETAAVRMQIDNSDLSVGYDVVVIRDGHNLVMVGQLALGGAADPEMVEEVARATVAKLADA